jgi:hypothetical protein
MTFTYDDSLYSDLFKDAHGFRPFNKQWSNLSSEQKQTEWNKLQNIVEQNIADDLRKHKHSIQYFETVIEEFIESGASDRETAIRWIADSEDVNGDMDLLCYKYNLPYNYFK